jgi:hypothetical protein
MLMLDVQIMSPSGKALFQWTSDRTGTIDFYICALSFGNNALGERQRIGATVSVYKDGEFIWCAPSHPPWGGVNLCPCTAAVTHFCRHDTLPPSRAQMFACLATARASDGSSLAAGCDSIFRQVIAPAGSQTVSGP